MVSFNMDSTRHPGQLIRMATMATLKVEAPWQMCHSLFCLITMILVEQLIIIYKQFECCLEQFGIFEQFECCLDMNLRKKDSETEADFF